LAFFAGLRADFFAFLAFLAGLRAAFFAFLAFFAFFFAAIPCLLCGERRLPPLSSLRSPPRDRRKARDPGREKK
jgi:hypothetical protein